MGPEGYPISINRRWALLNSDGLSARTFVLFTAEAGEGAKTIRLALKTITAAIFDLVSIQTPGEAFGTWFLGDSMSGRTVGYSSQYAAELSRSTLIIPLEALPS
jgi:hypothetical protein